MQKSTWALNLTKNSNKNEKTHCHLKKKLLKSDGTVSVAVWIIITVSEIKIKTELIAWTHEHKTNLTKIISKCTLNGRSYMKYVWIINSTPFSMWNISVTIWISIKNGFIFFCTFTIRMIQNKSFFIKFYIQNMNSVKIITPK